MSSGSDIAISVRGLSKAYTIAHNQERHITLAETLLARMKNPFKRIEKETFWALKDVSFDVKKGEVVGIIGRNGAGKSTLLKLLSRITEPTKGEIDLYGRVGSLLEVGTGFHPELTGRENVFLNGAILGMNRREVTKQFDAIVEFAEVEKFLDTPVKRYSSGMYVRLAFAVAAHLNPEILIVDEVLAVGDAEFQRKCLGKMKDVAGDGRTVLFVSHNMAAIRRLCNRAILLAGGVVEVASDVDEVLKCYNEGGNLGNQGSGSELPVTNRQHGITLESVDLAVDYDSEHAQFAAEFQICARTSGRIGLGLWVFTLDGIAVAKLLPGTTQAIFTHHAGRYQCKVEIQDIDRYLTAGDYSLGISLHVPFVETLIHAERVGIFTVPSLDVYGSGTAVELSRHGIVPLPVKLTSVAEFAPLLPAASSI